MTPSPQHLLHKFQRDPNKKTGYNSTAQKSSKVRDWIRPERGGAAGDETMSVKKRYDPKNTQQLVNSTPNMQCPPHLSALFVARPGNIDLQWQYRSYVSSKVSMMIKTLPESWPPHVGFRDSAAFRRPNRTLLHGASENRTSNTCEPLAELRTEQYSTFVNCQIHKTAFKRHHHPTEVTTTTSIMDPSLIEPTNVTNCPKPVRQSQHVYARMEQIHHVLKNFK